MMNLGTKLKLEEVEELMKEADPKGEGAIDLEDFAERMCPPKGKAKKSKGKAKKPKAKK